MYTCAVHGQKPFPAVPISPTLPRNNAIAPPVPQTSRADTSSADPQSMAVVSITPLMYDHVKSFFADHEGVTITDAVHHFFNLYPDFEQAGLLMVIYKIQNDLLSPLVVSEQMNKCINSSLSIAD